MKIGIFKPRGYYILQFFETLPKSIEDNFIEKHTIKASFIKSFKA